jgi:tetratricopeptide (TPR) repeat protein
MKTRSVLLSACIVFFSFNALANDAKYYEQMGKQISAVYAAKTIVAYQTAVNALDRIAAAERTKWEPFYYSAFGTIMMANEVKDGSKKDGYLDIAMASIEKAKQIAPAESEIIALEGFVHMIRLTVDPASRGQQYSMLSMQTFGKAVGMNPKNPRALLLMAQMQFGTAKFFNQEPTEACDATRKAVELFNTDKSENPLAPVWGKEMAVGLLKMCK